jgi:hypothetical protein
MKEVFKMIRTISSRKENKAQDLNKYNGMMGSALSKNPKALQATIKPVQQTKK